jgi:signal transduction histidine kinase
MTRSETPPPDRTRDSLYPEAELAAVDEEVGLRARFLGRIALASALISALIAAVRLVAGGEDLVALVVNGSAAVVFAIAAWLARGRAWRVGAWLLLVAATGALIAAGWLEGGIHADGLVWIAFPGWVASYVLSQRAAVGIGALAAAGVALLWGGSQLELTGSSRPEALDHLLRLVGGVGAVVMGLVVGWADQRRWRGSEASLRRATARARAMLDALPDTFVLLSREGRILQARASGGGELVGLGRLVGRPVRALLDEADAAVVLAAVAAVAADGSTRTVAMPLRLRGVVHALEARLAAHPDGNVIALLRDISERRRGERLREEFVAAVSHELRTPLTSIHGSLKLLQAEATGALPDEAAVVVELAVRNSERLRRLIDDLLDVQRMDLGQLELRPGLHRLGALLDAALLENRGYAEPRGVGLERGPAPEDAWVHVDEGRLEQVMGNLLSNAVKHSPHGGVVTVRAERVGERVRVSVVDRGPGVPAAFRPRVFETFAQADAGATRASGGTGLGLAICKRLIEASGGTIGFDSPEGEGATFWFELPEHPGPLARR